MSATEIPLDIEFEKCPNIKVDDIKTLREWLSTQPHLPGDKITDLDLFLVYHCCDRSTEVSKQLLDLNFTLRTMFPFFQYKTLAKTCNTMIFSPLMGSTVKGNRILYCHLMDSNPKNFIYIELVRQFTMIMDLWQYTDGTFPGLAIIVDMRNFSLGHLSRIDLSVAQQIFYYLQEAMFVKLEEFHFINAPSFMDKFLLLNRPFMKKRLLDMLQVHQPDSDSLEKVVDKTFLPKDLGGQYKDCVTLRVEQSEKIQLNKQFFEEESKKRVNESKRPGKPKTITNIFSGVEGTFKKLDID